MGRPGQTKQLPMGAHAGRTKMWLAMRMLRTFGADDIATASDCKPNSVQRYIRALKAGEYLRISTPKRNGERGGSTVYRLARDTGPVAPRVASTGKLYDANLAMPSVGSGSGRLRRHAPQLLHALRDLIVARSTGDAQILEERFEAASQALAAFDADAP